MKVPDDVASFWAMRKAASTPRALLLAERNANQTGTIRVPMVTTYHPKNTPVCKILSWNYNILTNDDSTRVIFAQPPLKAYRRAKNLRDLLDHSDFPPAQPAQQPGTFPCKRTICRTCAHINQSTSIQEDKLRSQGISRALQITLFIAFLAVNVLEQSTSGRQDADWLTVSGNTDSMFYTRKVTCLWRNTSAAQAIH